MLRLYDTANRAKVDFVPSVAGRVSMYVCGPTPYDVPHLGHGRKEVVFDTIRRYLLWRGFAVTSRTKLWSTLSASKEDAAKASSEE